MSKCFGCSRFINKKNLERCKPSLKLIKQFRICANSCFYNNSHKTNVNWHPKKLYLLIYSREIVSPNLVHVQRPLEEDSNNEMTDVWQMEFGVLNETIRQSDIKAIDKDIARMKKIPKIKKIASKLPLTDFYLPIVFQCYYAAFYGAAFDGRAGGFGCPNADNCRLPQREEHKCVHSDAEYYSGPHMVPFTYHFSNNSFWNWNIGCYQ